VTKADEKDLSQERDLTALKDWRIIRMTCNDFSSLVAAWFDCEMSAIQLAAFYAHMAECQDCLVHLHSYRSVVKLVREERRII
jgi:hypothetical protein